MPIQVSAINARAATMIASFANPSLAVSIALNNSFMSSTCRHPVPSGRRAEEGEEESKRATDYFSERARYPPPPWLGHAHIS
jgi:hypothetical protein